MTPTQPAADIEALLEAQNQHLQKLHAIVAGTIQEADLITTNLLHPPQEILSRDQQLSDRVARFGGSWKFIVLFMLVLAGWIIFNSLALGRARFDPYPFILMNLVLSCIAAVQAPIIMMSQNRQEEKDRKRGENDYLVNLKAELEIRSLHQKLDLLVQDQFKTLYETQARQLAYLRQIDEKLHQQPGQ